jgi:hypothetical protein
MPVSTIERPVSVLRQRMLEDMTRPALGQSQLYPGEPKARLVRWNGVEA